MGKQRFGLALGLSLMLLTAAVIPVVRADELSAVSQVNNGKRYALQGVTFETPVNFSEPKPIKGGGVGVLYPANAALGNEDLRVTLLTVPATKVLDGMTDQEMSAWSRYVYLDNASPPGGAVERTFLGRVVQGEAYIKQSGQRRVFQEVYVVPLSTGERLAVVFEADSRLPLQVIESLINPVTGSMRELAPKSKEWKNSYKWNKQKKQD
jgi:hypothetical protein